MMNIIFIIMVFYGLIIFAGGLAGVLLSIPRAGEEEKFITINRKFKLHTASLRGFKTESGKVPRVILVEPRENEEEREEGRELTGPNS